MNIRYQVYLLVFVEKEGVHSTKSLAIRSCQIFIAMRSARAIGNSADVLLFFILLFVCHSVFGA